jgi:hypothetical protein
MKLNLMNDMFGIDSRALSGRMIFDDAIPRHRAGARSLGLCSFGSLSRRSANSFVLVDDKQ